MSAEFGSVTLWLHRLRTPTRDQAVEKLWQAYFHKLVSLAKRRLAGKTFATADEEDIALSAFHSFVRAADAGRFPRLDDRDDLWQVLLHVTSTKLADIRVYDAAKKRNSGNVVPMSAVVGDEGGELPVPAGEPDPAEAAALGEAVEERLRDLDDADLRKIAVWKLEGYTNEEIAGLFGRSVATVERKLARIREKWESRPPLRGGECE